MSHLCLDIQQMFILSSSTSYECLQSPLTKAKRNFFDPSRQITLVYRHRHSYWEGSLVGISCTFSKTKQRNKNTSSFPTRICASPAMGLWPGLWYTMWVPSCGMGINFNQKAVDYLYNRAAIIAPVDTFCLTSTPYLKHFPCYLAQHPSFPSVSSNIVKLLG